VFEWGDGTAKARQWVGVIQVAGLQVEILPKIDGGHVDTAQHRAHANLLYMLSVAGDVPLLSRDVAQVALRRVPLSETLAAIFADRLLAELLRGPERTYVAREENLRRFKGKLLISPQMTHNAAHRERFYCRFDEFCEDTPMNQVFRAACKVLLGATRTPKTQDLLQRCLLVLGDVSDVADAEALLGKVAMSRQNERFAEVFRFCRLILSGQSPTAEGGRQRSFSLLFDMNVVFERFVAAFLRKWVLPNHPGLNLYAQARQRTRHLMEHNSKGALPLKPDLLIEGPAGRNIVIDTKWKRLTDKKTRDGVAVADMHQLYAYSQRYDCQRSVLLYPAVGGTAAKDYDVLDHQGQKTGQQVGVRFVNLHRDLARKEGQMALAEELGLLLAQVQQMSTLVS
jgi:5-methylcytosine-specific restriction enzyme subunit McrC